MTDSVLAWHYEGDTATTFPNSDFGDGKLYSYRTILHASYYSPTPLLRRVRASGDIRTFEMTAISSERIVLAETESHEVGEYVHDTFARIIAAEVLQYWDAPDVVVEWLSTGAPDLFDGASEESRRVVEENPEDPSKYAARALMWATAWPGRTTCAIYRVREALREVWKVPNGKEIAVDLHILAEDLIPAMLGWDMDEIDGGGA